MMDADIHSKDERGHHPTLAPSSIPAVLACARFESAPSESRPGGEYAAMGTEHHREFAAMLRGDRALADGLPIEERAGVEQGVAYVRGVCDPKLLSIEERIEVYDENFDLLTWGTPDAWSYGNSKLQTATSKLSDDWDGTVPDLFDYKSGMPRDYDGQVAAYALGIMQQTGARAVNAHLIFGRTGSVGKRQWGYDEAMALVTKSKARREDATIEAQPCDYCGWCSKVLTCPALAKRVESVRAGREDWALEQYHASQITEPSEMSKALALAKVLKKWCEAIEHFANEMARKQGLQLPGWELKERRGNREVVDLVEAFKLSGLTQETFLACCEVSLGALEIAYAKVKQCESLAAAKRELTSALGGVVGRKKSSFYLKSKTEKADE